ncbi:MAG: glycosyltransferase [Rhizobiales bacterium]|nr:glycosyltransferase [Hyphomicrobiales bacterium]
MRTTGRKGSRPRVHGKFIFANDEKLYIRGVTYGPFRPDECGCEYHNPEVVDNDFALMAANGINTVRTYTVPPRWLLDSARQHGLWVMVGLPWEQHITFLDHPRQAQSIEDRVREGVRICAGHPAVLCYSIGNEIPASIVRWYGRQRVERFLKRLYRGAKAEDPESLVTYVNYPTTEYLQLPFIDFVCFNVYLESQDLFDAYVARLQTLAGDRPLLLAEVGLDSRRNGEEAQAQVLDWQVRAMFDAGCAGGFVYAWTDEWHRGGLDVDDWDFGLTSRERHPKPALRAVRQAFMEVPFQSDASWPRISVVVCSYNGSRTIRACCESLLELDYPNYEVIVVDDGSTDSTAAIAGSYGFRVISAAHVGLSQARNIGMEAATGEIIAYTDDDTRADPQWLGYLAALLMRTDHAGVGGPNIAPPDDGFVADAVTNAPGGPIHVLLSDREAEHIPGCNMAFWKACLQEIGGFDPQFRAAGDDVDVCWRLQARGWTLGFSPAALVWHHRRSSVRSFLKQQLGYGRAEALLEIKWPEKYNRLGHVNWKGHPYGKGVARGLSFLRWRVYHGVWGSHLFQSIYASGPTTLWSLFLMPEWLLVVGVLLLLSLLGIFWPPLMLALPVLILAVGALLTEATASAAQAAFPTALYTRTQRFGLYSLTALLYLLQPLARLLGRLQSGLTLWRRRGRPDFVFPRTRAVTLWSKRWRAAEARLATIEDTTRAHGALVRRGGDFDRWDLEVLGGILGSARLLMTIEEHGEGRQLARFHLWPRFWGPGLAMNLALVLLAALAALDHAWIPALLLGLTAIMLVVRAFGDCAAAMAFQLRALEAISAPNEESDGSTGTAVH